MPDPNVPTDSTNASSPANSSGSIFRKDALTNLSSPDQLDQLMIVTRPRAWISLFGIGIVLCGILVWAFLARIPTTLSGVGIIEREGGVYQIVAPSTGIIRKLNDLASGSIISKGEVIGFIDQPMLRFQIDEMKSSLERVKRNGTQSDLLEQKIRELEFEYKLKTEITSPVNGIVVEKKTTTGEAVTAGTNILSMESENRDLEVIIYIPILRGAKQLKPGITAQVSPVTIDKSLYGYLEGEVVSVSEFPSTEQEMLLVLGNKGLVELDNSMGPPYAVTVKLKRDPTSANGFAWSSPNGKSAQISSGLLANTKFVLNQQAPISLLFPMLGAK